MNAEFENDFQFENPYETNNNPQNFVGNLNDENKYIDNSKSQDPYWMQSGTGPKQSSEGVSLGTEKEVNSTFELNFDNPYAQQIQKNEEKAISQENEINEANSSNPLLQEMNELSSKLSDFSNLTSNYEGIGQKKEHEVIVKLENVDKNVEEPQSLILPEEPVTSFLGSTASLPIIDNTQSFPSSNVLSFNNLPLDYSTKRERKPLSKSTKILLWILVPFVIVASLFWLIFWSIEYTGATDLVIWQGFDPSTTV